VDKLEVPTRLESRGWDVHPAGNPHIQLDPHNIAKVGLVLSQRLEQIDAGNALITNRAARTSRALAQAISRWEKDAAPLKGCASSLPQEHGVFVSLAGMTEVMYMERNRASPQCWSSSDLVARLQAEPADAVIRTAYQDPKAAGWLSEKTRIPVVELPYTVGGTAAAKDLFACSTIRSQD